MAPLPSHSTEPRRTIRPPQGCEHHLTRKQAASLLGFASEFKVRQLEKEGRLHGIRGSMGTAFYDKAELLALRSQLQAPVAGEGREFTDAELLDLLVHPLPAGRMRTALDLVLETKISIARAEAIVGFHSRHQPAEAPAKGSPAPLAQPPVGVAKERRAQARRSRDDLIRSLRHPDPKVRERAFQDLRRPL